MRAGRATEGPSPGCPGPHDLTCRGLSLMKISKSRLAAHCHCPLSQQRSLLVVLQRRAPGRRGPPSPEARGAGPTEALPVQYPSGAAALRILRGLSRAWMAAANAAWSGSQPPPMPPPRCRRMGHCCWCSSDKPGAEFNPGYNNSRKTHHVCNTCLAKLKRETQVCAWVAVCACALCSHHCLPACHCTSQPYQTGMLGPTPVV